MVICPSGPHGRAHRHNKGSPILMDILTPQPLCHLKIYVEPCRTWWHQAITWSNVDLPSKVSCGIHMRAISQGMFMNLIHNMCSEFALFKIITTTPRGQGVKSDGGPWGAILQLESSPTGLLWYLLFANQNYIPNLVIWFVLEIRHHPCRSHHLISNTIIL